jgi:RHS repeat-associated protein
VSEYLTSGGTVAAHFEYDPFGNLTGFTEQTEGFAANFTYRFSTKPQDPVTGLYYYGYRWYDPLTGRWHSRDLIEEGGGFNLYGFLRNNGVHQQDSLGLVAADPAAMVEVVHAGSVEAHKASETEYLDQIKKEDPTVSYPAVDGGRPFTPKMPREYGGRVCEHCEEGEDGKLIYTYYLTQSEGSWPSSRIGASIYLIEGVAECKTDRGDVQVGWWHTHPSSLVEEVFGGTTRESKRYRYYWSAGRTFSNPTKPGEFGLKGDVSFHNSPRMNPNKLPLFVTYRNAPSYNDGWRYYTDQLPGGRTVRRSRPMKPEWIDYNEGERMPTY